MEAVIVRDNGRIYKLDQNGYRIESEICDLEGNLIAEHEMRNEEALEPLEKLYDLIDILSGQRPNNETASKLIISYPKILQKLEESTEMLESLLFLFGEYMALTTRYGVEAQLNQNKEVIKQANETE